MKWISVFLFSLISIKAKALLPLNSVDFAQFPATVALKIEPISSTCTAVKISAQVFLTAAHCLELLKRTPHQRLILYRMTKDRRSSGEYTPKNIKVRLHPSYYRQETSLGTVRNFLARDNADIALLQIDTATPEIPLQNVSFLGVKVGQKIIVGGFGVDQKSCHNYDSLPCALNMRTQVVQSVGSNLFYSHPSSSFPAYLTPGDSGGPVYDQSRSVVGINVLGFPTLSGALKNMLGADTSTESASGYLDLKNYSQWLQQTLSELK
jgi:secreted trypsin-like serine protease